MFAKLFRSVFGSANDRLVKNLNKYVPMINGFEPAISALSDEDLRHKTVEFREKLAQGASLDDILPEAFATIREASKRVLGQRHYDVQLIGGLALHKGMIAEMKTGEGKTLMSTLAVYLNALSEKGVHVVTVNDYLARRDAEWMGSIYRFLGLTVGCIVHGITEEERRQAYNSDITYGTNHEFGFDYLRDNMKFRKSDRVMRAFNYAIIDEVDSILIDEARTPLIISGPAEDSSELYKGINAMIPELLDEDIEKDEKQKTVTLTESGVEKVESWLREKGFIAEHTTLYDVHNMSLVHHTNAALRAHKMYHRDVDYIVKDNQIILIDEFTGRMMDGRRYSDGLHQAIEAKEHVKVQTENQTLASITYQNYFRLYPKIGGMAGTAATEASEFEEIYRLKVVEIPTHVPVQRKDLDDEIYLTMPEKYNAIIKLIRECRSRNQPVLVGTTSIERNEFLSNLLKKEGIEHAVLNARYHDQEATIIANAGRLGAVTVATNMAGRGTDIKLGGSVEARVSMELSHLPEGELRTQEVERIKKEVAEEQEKVLASGGLYVIGTERHESRRIDNQLRGRSGRQGDPGESKFFISLQDDLMRIFGSERMEAMLRRLGAVEGEAISHSWINSALERAQQKVEARNFDMRKHLLQYDDVMNDQRKIIYDQRLSLMENSDIRETITEMCEDVVRDTVEKTLPAEHHDNWNVPGLHAELLALTGEDMPIHTWVDDEGATPPQVIERAMQIINEKRTGHDTTYGEDFRKSIESTMMLRILDQHWKDHLLTLDHLRQGINLRSYAQSNPLNEYKREAFNLFENMLDAVRADMVKSIVHFKLDNPEHIESVISAMLPKMNFENLQEQTTNETAPVQDVDVSSVRHAVDFPLADSLNKPVRKKAENIDPNDPSTWGRVLRNALCPCNSGKKYKQCHGEIA